MFSMGFQGLTWWTFGPRGAERDGVDAAAGAICGAGTDQYCTLSLQFNSNPAIPGSPKAIRSLHAARSRNTAEDALSGTSRKGSGTPSLNQILCGPYFPWSEAVNKAKLRLRCGQYWPAFAEHLRNTGN